MPPDPFFVKDCALIAIANGEKAQNLRELRDRLEMTPVACVYYHFWGGMLRPRFDDPEYQNDFASWAAHSLHDKILAERLSSIDPTAYDNLEELRQAVIEIIEIRLDESETVVWTDVDKQFYFVRSQIVVFDTGVIVSDPEDMRLMLPGLSLGSIFYHFIDARRRTAGNLDDFTEWLLGFEDQYARLITRITTIDPYFNTLSELREALNMSFNECMTAGIER